MFFCFSFVASRNSFDFCPNKRFFPGILRGSMQITLWSSGLFREIHGRIHGSIYNIKDIYIYIHIIHWKTPFLLTEIWRRLGFETWIFSLKNGEVEKLRIAKKATTSSPTTSQRASKPIGGFAGDLFPMSTPPFWPILWGTYTYTYTYTHKGTIFDTFVCAA